MHLHIVTDSFTTYCICQLNTSQDVRDSLSNDFSSLTLPQPSLQTLHHIYHTRMAPHFDTAEFPTEVRTMRSDIVAAVLGVYHSLTKKLKATPTRCHYLFDMRDITKVFLKFHMTSTIYFLWFDRSPTSHLDIFRHYSYCQRMPNMLLESVRNL